MSLEVGVFQMTMIELIREMLCNDRMRLSRRASLDSERLSAILRAVCTYTHTHLLLCTPDFASCSSVNQSKTSYSCSDSRSQENSIYITLHIPFLAVQSRRVSSNALLAHTDTLPQSIASFFHSWTVPTPAYSIYHQHLVVSLRYTSSTPTIYNEWTIVDMSLILRVELPFTDYAFRSNIPDVTTSYSCPPTPYLLPVACFH
jgi:hypothetical protein